ncbi:MAG: AraC family transcriptional regulator [Gemmatimonadaceae bacterium]|nr:AraC family transcriptional regulator [Gemmatimonadaceae bacterium]
MSADGSAREQPRAFLVGQITGPFVVHPTENVDLMAVRFEPHGAAALTPDLSLLTNHWKALDDLQQEASSPLSEVLESLQAVCRAMSSLTMAERFERLSVWLWQYTSVGKHADYMVAETVRAIVGSRGAVTIDDVAATIGVHVRTLQRRFTKQVGVSPKRLARTVRFHHVCQAWRRDPDTLARVAADCGYCDESHLVRDFRAFVGEPPATFLKALPAFSAHFL